MIKNAQIQEKDYMRKSAAIFRAARKKMGIKQIDFAGKLGISQSCVSKIESGLLMPSALQLAVFCQMTKVPSDAIFYGVIDSLTGNYLDKFDNGNNFKIPNKFKNHANVSMVLLRPLLRIIEQEVGEKKYEDAFDNLKMDIDYTYILSHKINWVFVNSLIQELGISRDKLVELLDSNDKVLARSEFGDFFTNLTNESNELKRVQSFINQVKKLNSEFHFIESKVKEGKITLIFDNKRLAFKKNGSNDEFSFKDLFKWELKQVFDCFGLGKQLVCKENYDNQIFEMEFIAC